MKRRCVHCDFEWLAVYPQQYKALGAQIKCPQCGELVGAPDEAADGEVDSLRLTIAVLLVILGGTWFTTLIAFIVFLWLAMLQHALNLGEWGILCLFLLLAVFFTPALGSMGWFFITIGVDRMRTWIRRLPS